MEKMPNKANSIYIDVELYKDHNKYCIYAARDGDSGIKITGNTKEKIINDFKDYLMDYFMGID